MLCIKVGTRKTTAPPNPMTDPSMMTEMVKGNMTSMVPMMVVGGWINWHFSGFVTTKVIFFKLIFQKTSRLIVSIKVWLFGWLFGWLIDCFVDCIIKKLISSLTFWFIDWLVGYKIGFYLIWQRYWSKLLNWLVDCWQIELIGWCRLH